MCAESFCTKCWTWSGVLTVVHGKKYVQAADIETRCHLTIFAYKEDPGTRIGCFATGWKGIRFQIDRETAYSVRSSFLSRVFVVGAIIYFFDNRLNSIIITCFFFVYNISSLSAYFFYVSNCINCIVHIILTIELRHNDRYYYYLYTALTIM